MSEKYSIEKTKEFDIIMHNKEATTHKWKKKTNQERLKVKTHAHIQRVWYNLSDWLTFASATQTSICTQF